MTKRAEAEEIAFGVLSDNGISPTVARSIANEISNYLDDEPLPWSPPTYEPGAVAHIYWRREDGVICNGRALRAEAASLWLVTNGYRVLDKDVRSVTLLPYGGGPGAVAES